MKKILTILTIVLVAITALIPVMSFAADESITLTITAPEGSGIDITKKTISVYKLFALTTEIEDENKAYHYSWDGLTSTEAFFTSKGYDTVIEATEYVRTLSGTELTKLAEDYYTFCQGREDAVVYTKNVDEEKIFTDLAQGYCLVYDVQEADDNTAKSVAILSNLEEDVTVPLKIETVKVDKEVDQTTANVGDTVNFTVTSSVPDTTGYETYQFIVTDTLSEGLTLNQDSIKVTVGGTDYTAYTKTATTNQDGTTTLTITFASQDFLQLTADSEIKVTYSAILNESAVEAIENSNEVTITYSNDPTSSSTGITVPEKVYVYTYTVDFTKKNTAGETLNGAQFVLQTTDEQGNTKYVSLSPDDFELVESQENATPFASDDKGKFSIAGLEAGTYTLVETVAPNGYSLPNFDGFTFTISQTLDEEGKLTSASYDYTTDEENVVAKGYMTDGSITTAVAFEIDVLNAQGTGLPSTGGMGTTIFTIIGIAVMATAGAVFVIRNRKVTE